MEFGSKTIFYENVHYLLGLQSEMAKTRPIQFRRVRVSHSDESLTFM